MLTVSADIVNNVKWTIACCSENMVDRCHFYSFVTSDTEIKLRREHLDGFKCSRTIDVPTRGLTRRSTVLDSVGHCTEQANQRQNASKIHLPASNKIMWSDMAQEKSLSMYLGQQTEPTLSP